MIIMEQPLTKKDIVPNVSSSYKGHLSFINKVWENKLEVVGKNLYYALVYYITTSYWPIVFTRRGISNLRNESKDNATYCSEKITSFEEVLNRIDNSLFNHLPSFIKEINPIPI